MIKIRPLRYTHIEENRVRGEKKGEGGFLLPWAAAGNAYRGRGRDPGMVRQPAENLGGGRGRSLYLHVDRGRPWLMTCPLDPRMYIYTCRFLERGPTRQIIWGRSYPLSTERERKRGGGDGIGEHKWRLESKNLAGLLSTNELACIFDHSSIPVVLLLLRPGALYSSITLYSSICKVAGCDDCTPPGTAVQHSLGDQSTNKGDGNMIHRYSFSETISLPVSFSRYISNLLVQVPSKYRAAGV
jgi:hypothetical protein